jgi:hypothetical protein
LRDTCDVPHVLPSVFGMIRPESPTSHGRCRDAHAHAWMKSKHIRDTDSMPINAKAFRQHVLRNAYQVEIETVRSHTLSLKVVVPGVSLAGIAITVHIV